MNIEKPMLVVENISKMYGEKEVLRGVSFAINKGELKIIIGPSGAGKSTLLQCINFLVVPNGGQIWLEDKEVIYTHKKELYRHRQSVGMIFQDFNLFDHLNSFENVKIGLIKVKGIEKKEAEERAVFELDRVGLKEHIYKYPAQLSGGQKQRVSIARALAMDPKVMLLDEPTSALDPELISEVLSVIRDLRAEGMTMLMSTHHIGFAREVADEIIFMEDGCIAEKGHPMKILFQADHVRTREFCATINELYGGGE